VGARAKQKTRFWIFRKLRVGLYSRRDPLPDLRTANQHGHDALSSHIFREDGQRLKLGEAHFRSKLLTPEEFSVRHPLSTDDGVPRCKGNIASSFCVSKKSGSFFDPAQPEDVDHGRKVVLHSVYRNRCGCAGIADDNEAAFRQRSARAFEEFFATKILKAMHHCMTSAACISLTQTSLRAECWAVSVTTR